jgi:superfamily II DNA or RNA helicase
MVGSVNVVATKINEVFHQIEAPDDLLDIIDEYFTFKDPKAWFSPAYKTGKWDGRRHIFKRGSRLLYSGLVGILKQWLQSKFEIELKIPEQAAIPFELPDELPEYNFIPFAHQVRGLKHAAANPKSIILSPTGSGKSFLIFMLVDLVYRLGLLSPKEKVLILVPNLSLIKQTTKAFKNYLPELPFTITNERNIESQAGQVTIINQQAIMRYPRSWFRQFSVFIADEVHKFKAATFVDVSEKLSNCRYRWGFTGTLDDLKINKIVLTGLFGQAMRICKTIDLIEAGLLEKMYVVPLIFEYTDEVRKICPSIAPYVHASRTKTGVEEKLNYYSKEIKFLTQLAERNDKIVELASSLRGSTLVLFTYIKHGKLLYEKISDKVGEENCHYIAGEVDVGTRELIRKRVNEIDGQVIVASYKTFSEGIDIPNLHNLVFASPMKSKIVNIQSIGRVLRKSDSGQQARIFDVIDNIYWGRRKGYARKHGEFRAGLYKKEGFELAKAKKVEII